MRDTPQSDGHGNESTFKLCAMFGVFYFVQGIAEPTAGLVSQPVKSLLKSWGSDAGEIGFFSLLLAAPWYCKPLFGLFTDFLPLAGYRRKSYLLVTSAITAAALITLSVTPIPAGAATLLLGLLFVPTLCIAFSDVVVDGLMVDKGQPRGLTGRLQSVQWGFIWAATIITGTLGGKLSEYGLQKLGFFICGCVTIASLLVTAFWVREKRLPKRPAGLSEAVRELWQVATSRAVLPIAAFLFLWNFNPFAVDVQYVYMTRDFGFSESFYGETISWSAASSMIASFAYGLYCRKVPRRWLVHLSIVGGILTTIAYWGLRDENTAILISIATGATYATAQMVQLDLAAQSIPPAVAGTSFALLMSLSNFGTQLSTAVGGWLYEHGKTAWDEHRSFHALVAVGAATTAACWLLTPVLAKPVAPPNLANAPVEQ